MTKEILIDIAEAEALRRWEAGEKPSFSVGICETFTAGYGKCDDNGYWEFQLPYPSEQWLSVNQKQMTLWESIVTVSKRIRNQRTEQDVFNKLIEEVGELAVEIAVHNKSTYKKGGPDGIVGEAVDAINCLVDLIRVHRPDLTEVDIATIAYDKQLKWERHYMQDEQERRDAKSAHPGWTDKGM